MVKKRNSLINCKKILRAIQDDASRMIYSEIQSEHSKTMIQSCVFSRNSL